MRLRLFTCLSLSAALFAACDTDGDDPVAELSAPIVGACDYTSPFTQLAECREYVGELWEVDNVQAACDTLTGTLEVDGRCEPSGLLGRCAIDMDTEAGITVFSYGDDASTCAGQKMGCEVFGGGEWRPEAICDGVSTGGGMPGTVFEQPTLNCQDPLPGEPTGQSADGQVCTWQAISGATEEGRRFEDYASCDIVRTQRPYYSAPPAEGADAPDARLDDPAYAAELDWVRSQIEASACVCCHTDDAPGGASSWSLDSPGNWINTFRDSGLALGANWVSSVAFGAYPPEDNNGFERETSGFPSTDPERMRAFFVNELAHRGKDASDFADAPPFGGPIADQLTFVPTACPDGIGVQRDGTIVWEGGAARYVYVLEAGSGNPTVPPNLDLPEGTRWRVDVPATASPLESGTVSYGLMTGDSEQRFPSGQAPAPLEPGQDYYLYVTQDVAIPITRCLFSY